MYLLQVDPTEIIKDVASVDTSTATGYGYLVAVLIALCIGLGWAIYQLYKSLQKGQQKREEMLEKSFAIAEAQKQMAEKEAQNWLSAHGKLDTIINVSNAILAKP